MSNASVKARPGTKTRVPTAKAKGAVVASGIVDECIHGVSAKSSKPEWTPSRVVDALRAGLPISELHELQSHLDVPMEKLSQILGISKATLHRRMGEGRLDAFESDRVVRFARLLGRAVEVMESEAAARQWLTAPQIGLGGEVPLVYAESEVGAREVEDLLGRIEHGVYS